MSKTDFIIIYQEVRDQIAKKSTIQHAWQKSGLFPLRLEFILDKIAKKEQDKTKLKVQPLTLPRVFHVSAKEFTVLAPLQTPANITDIDKILEKVKLGVYTELDLEKLSKETSLAFAKNTTLQITNETLLEKDDEMKKQAQCSKKQLGKGQIMGQKVLEQQRVMVQSKQDKKAFWDIWKATMSLFKESKQTKAVTTLEKHQAMTHSKLEERNVKAQSKQKEKIHWDIWKNVIDLFKEPKQKIFCKKTVVEEETALESEILSEIKDSIFQPAPAMTKTETQTQTQTGNPDPD